MCFFLYLLITANYSKKGGGGGGGEREGSPFNTLIFSYHWVRVLVLGDRSVTQLNIIDALFTHRNA